MERRRSSGRRIVSASQGTQSTPNWHKYIVKCMYAYMMPPYSVLAIFLFVQPIWKEKIIQVQIILQSKIHLRVQSQVQIKAAG